MFARLGKVLVIAALVLITGAHWAALQTVAWTTMLAANMSCENFSTAVSETFDGKHLCPLCRAIAAAKKSEKKSEAVAPTLKMEYPPAPEPITLFPPASFEVVPAQNTFAESFSSKPSLPPPRRLFV